MNDVVKKIFAIFTQQDRRHFFWLLGPVILTAIFDVIGIAFVVPFMAVVANPLIIEQSQKLHWVYSALHFTNAHRFLLFLGLVALGLLIFGNALGAITTWLMQRFSFEMEYKISNRLLETYLRKNYSFFLNRNTSKLAKNILNDVSSFVSAVLVQALMMFSKSVGVFFILTLLFIIKPFLAVGAMVVLGGSYFVVFKLVRKKLTAINRILFDAHNMKFKTASEVFGGIKNIKLLGLEDNFLQEYITPSKTYVESMAVGQSIAQLPKYMLETIAFGGILVIVLFLLSINYNSAQMISMLALYAFAGYRLMPALQTIFASLTLIKANKASLDVIYDELCEANKVDASLISTNKSIPVIKLQKKIELRNLEFAYLEGQQQIFDTLNLTIDAKTTVGIVGATGAGKTTAVDIILGLLRPQKGELLVDDVAIIDNLNLRGWQKNLGYVPQDVYLTDDTVARNIAFGIPKLEISYNAVEHAAKLANLHDFVIKELPLAYQTEVGERGVRLSGGQRQRIGIARALYHDPEVLVFDEATSALDGVTETIIMEAIHNLSHKKTIILIAHRLSTVKNCDVIYLLDKGEVKAKGTYVELMETSHHFRNMAQVNNGNYAEQLNDKQ